MLNEIKSKLEEIDEHVDYGLIDPKKCETTWNCIVFNRVSLKPNGGRTSYSDYFDVHIWRENFIPIDLDTEVIEKMKEIHGVRLTEQEATFNYIAKSGTNAIVEILTLHFVRARKDV